MKTSERLRTLRIDRTNTQSEIALLIGCSRVSYIDYESGRRSVPLRGLVILAGYYRVSADFLLGLTSLKRPYPSFCEAIGEASDGGCAADPRQVGCILKSLRCSRSFTQREVADHLGCTQAGYCGYESGKRSIPPEIIVRLSGFYNVSADYLLGLTYSTLTNS